MKRPRPDMVNDPVGPTLRRLAIPMMLGGLSIMTFNLVDTFFVGQLGAEPLAAMAFTFPVVFIVMSLSMGMAVGTGAVVGRALGSGDKHRARVLATGAVTLATIMVAVASTVGLVTIKPVFTALGAPAALLPLIEDYMSIWYIGAAFIVVPMVGNSAIRAAGDAKTPARIMMTAAGVNILLDPFLIFGIGPFPAMGLQGAALATAISFSVTFAAGLYILAVRERLFTWCSPRALAGAWGSILHIGGPAALTATLTPLATAWLTRLAAEQGADIVAALGVVTRVESVALAGVMGISSVITPFMGQNLGAARDGRIREAYRYSLRFTLAWGAGAAIVLAALAPLIAMAFSDDPGVRQAIRSMFWIIPITYGAGAWLQVSASASNGLGRPLDATLLNVFRLLIPVGLVAWVGATWFGPMGLFIGIGIGNLLSGAAAWLRLRYAVRTCVPAEADMDSVEGHGTGIG